VHQNAALLLARALAKLVDKAKVICDALKAHVVHWNVQIANAIEYCVVLSLMV
jgi:hypothetical protein